MDEVKELWLVRHGETTASAGHRIAGWSDPPLTADGRRQAEAVRARLDGTRFASVWSSDLDRALNSARLGWGEPQIDQRLREVDFGPLEGRAYDEVDGGLTEVFMVFRDFQIPGGESHQALKRRVQGFVDELPPGRHLLFVHSNPNTTMLGNQDEPVPQPQGSQPMRAYVVERDIQQTTSRVRRLSEFATLG